MFILLLALPATAGEITFAGPGGLRSEPDPRAPVPALRLDRQTFAALVAPDVGLLVEAAEGAPVHVSNMLAGAVVRRLSGHVEARRALETGRVLTLEPRLSVSRGSVVADWRLTDERGAFLGAQFAASRLSGRGEGFARFTPQDAERLAFQVAAQFLGAGSVADAIRSAAALAQIERSPSPAARPAAEAD